MIEISGYYFIKNKNKVFEFFEEKKLIFGRFLDLDI